MEMGEKMRVAAKSTRTTSSKLISRFGISHVGAESRAALKSPFEPIASILEHCEEKTGAIMKPSHETA